MPSDNCVDKNDKTTVESEEIFTSFGVKSTESIDRFTEPFQGKSPLFTTGTSILAKSPSLNEKFPVSISLESTEVNNGVPKDTSSGRNL